MMAVDWGAAVIGLVGPMPSGPGVIDSHLARQIAQTVPTPIDTYLLTSSTSAADIVAHYREVKTTAIQIVDELQQDVYSLLREKLPFVKLVQVIHVRSNESIEKAVAIAPHVDAILLDSGNPSLPTKELGGTGRIHNWAISSKIREQVQKPVWLAGGLTVDNVQEAIAMVQPYGVDVCSGVRTQGRLDAQKLKDFIAAAIQ